MKKEIIEWIYCIIIALVLALLFRYFIATPTIVKHSSMFPTLQEGQRLILNRTFRITHQDPQIGDIITFEAPTRVYTKLSVDQSNPIAIYERTSNGLFDKFLYNCLEITKTSYIKRVIATAGDHVKIEDNHIFVNEKQMKEEYLSDDIITVSEVFYDFIVPEGYLFAMGDNRANSTDCRGLGCIPLDKGEN